jgi:hypothetical protein
MAFGTPIHAIYLALANQVCGTGNGVFQAYSLAPPFREAKTF